MQCVLSPNGVYVQCVLSPNGVYVECVLSPNGVCVIGSTVRFSPNINTRFYILVLCTYICKVKLLYELFHVVTSFLCVCLVLLARHVPRDNDIHLVGNRYALTVARTWDL